MAILSQGRSQLQDELDKLKNELRELQNRYELLMESSASYFFIFEEKNVLEFSPKAEDRFVFTSDFADKTLDELMPIFQLDGEQSKITWTKQVKLADMGPGQPFKFDYLDKNGISFTTFTTIKKVAEERFLAHIELIEQQVGSTAEVNAVADNAPAFIRMFDAKKAHTYLNKGWQDLLGIETS